MLRFVGSRATKSLVNHSLSLNVLPNRVGQTRTFLGSKLDLIKTRQKLDNEPSVENALAYIKALGAQKPHDASTFIQKGWTNGQFPMNDAFLKEFLKCVHKQGKMDSLDMAALLSLVSKHNGQTTATSGSDIAAILAASKSSSPFTAGSSPEEPIFVRTAPPTWKATGMKMLQSAVGLYIVFVLINAMLDNDSSNKNGGGSPGGAGMGGIASRLGIGGSIVKQAEKSDKTFADVVGVDEAKYDLQEIVMYLKDPKKFTRLGGKLPKGVLLTGPPGTGKTLLARAIAGEAGVPFYHTSGSEFEEMYVGVGAKRVRELFDVAKANSPCIIFIDEIDAIGGARQLKDASAMKMTLNQLLVEMDGFAQNNGVIVIAATNFPDSLDKALIRPGRLDKHVDVPMPDIGGRRAILELYSSKIPMDSDVNLEQLARGTPGFSGAELFNLVNQAALKASVEGLKSVGMSALEFAKDKIMMGAERKSAVISAETMKMTAFHEAGHALVALKTEGSNPIHKATIMPRGRALGMVMQLPEGDQTSQSRKQMLAYLDVCMGGRVAEELIFGPQNVTSGASSDIQQATNLAKAMVTRYGFSEKVGIMFIDESKQSGETSKFVDEEVRELLQASYNRAKHLLETHRKELDMIATGLMEYESLSGHEIVELTQGKPLNLVKRSQKPSRPIKEVTNRVSSATTTTAPVPGSVAVKNESAAPVTKNNDNNGSTAVKVEIPRMVRSAAPPAPVKAVAPTPVAPAAPVATEVAPAAVAAAPAPAGDKKSGLFGALGFRGKPEAAATKDEKPLSPPAGKPESKKE